MTCHCCQGPAKRFGFFVSRGERTQRYRCAHCGQTFRDEPTYPLDSMRVTPEKAAQVIGMLSEGLGIRSAARLSGVNRNTVLSLLETVGRKCAAFLKDRMRNVSTESVQVDELWARIAGDHPRTSRKGKFVFMAIDRLSKCILSYRVGLRTRWDSDEFMADLQSRLQDHPTVTTDGFQGYLTSVYNAFGSRVNFAQQIKQYANYGPEMKKDHREKTEGCVKVQTLVHIGNPTREQISTSHVERTNLTLRHFNKRFTRLTLGYTRKVENLEHSMALFCTVFNFCRVHSTIKTTPSVSAGLATEPWTISGLIEKLSGY